MTRTWVLVLTLVAAATARAEDKPKLTPAPPKTTPAQVTFEPAPAVTGPCPTAAGTGCGCGASCGSGLGCARRCHDCPPCLGGGQLLDWLCYRGCRSGAVGCCCDYRIPHLYLFFLDHPCIGGYHPTAEPGPRNCCCVSGCACK
jgi:hypothetical protein